MNLDQIDFGKPAAGDEKLTELTLYIAGRSANDLYFGSTKLNKALYWADMLFYARHGHTITNATYQKLPFGPAPRRIKPVMDALQACNRAAMSNRQTPLGRTQKRLVALDDANLALFSADEIKQVDYVLGELDGQTADELSERTHQEAGWICAADGETINPNAIFITIIEPTRASSELGIKAAQQQGLLSDDNPGNA